MSQFFGVTSEWTRLIRVVRIFRIARFLHLSQDLKLRVSSILESSRSLVSTMTLLSMLIYTFSVLFTEMANKAPVQTHALTYWYGNIARTGLTLLETVAGGVSWDEPCMVLFNDIGMFAGMLYLFYVSFGVFIMLNVIMGVFIDKAIKFAEEQVELDVACAISSAFMDDSDGLGVTREEFYEKLEEPELQECFEILNIDIGQAPVLFDLIDSDRSGNVDAQEIVEGCLRLKGGAKALDISVVEQAIFTLVDKVDRNVRTVDFHTKLVDSHTKLVDKHLCSLSRKLGVEPSANRSKLWI